jgi:hypothetical protein
VLPESQRDWNGINIERLPPYRLIARTMKLAMVQPTDWNEKFIAYCAA